MLSRPLPGMQMDRWLASRRDGPIARCQVPATAAAAAADDARPLRFRL